MAPLSRPVPALLTLLTLLLAGLAPTPAAAQAESYPAEVIENRVQVRSGAGRAYYEVGQLRRGDRVVVQNELFGWYRITPPDGVFCFIDRKNVDAKNDGSRGVVNTDDTNVMAAHVGGGPADSYRTLLKLGRGDTVEIVDTVSNVYKIRPPQGAYVYLPPNTLEPVQNQPAPPPQPTAPDTPADAEDNGPATTPGSSPRTAAQSPAPPTPDAVTTPEPADSDEPTPQSPATAAAPDRVDATGPQPPAVIGPDPATPDTAAAVPTNTPESDRPATATATPPPAPSTTPATQDIDFESPSPDETSDSAQAAVDAVLPTPEALLNDPSVRVARPEVPVATRANNEMLRAVEIAILPYFTLPVDQQPIAKMVRGYADAAQIDGLSDNDLAIIRNRLTELQRNRDQILQRLDAGDPAAAQATADPESPDAPAPGDIDVEPGNDTPIAATTTIPPTPPAAGDTEGTDDATAATAPGSDTSAASATPATPPTPAPPAGPPAFVSDYNAIGILIASTVHTGENQPKLLRLMDPTGRRTVAYLEPNPDINTLPLMGQLVGIVGQTIYDPTTKLNLIRPDQIDTLSPR